MQEKDVKDLPGGVAWTGVADRKDEVQEESWYQVWGRGLWAEIRSDAWYLEAMLYAIFLILLTWGKCSGELSALSETTVFDAMVRCPAQLLLMPKINQSSAHQHARTISSSEYGRVRVQPNTCPTTFQEEFQSVVPICFGEYTIRFQDVSGFGPVLDNGLERYLFSDQTENGEDSFTGQVNTYDGGGFRIVIPTDGSLEEARAVSPMRRMLH
eukprot:3294998-Rhodomonas_salina.3